MSVIDSKELKAWLVEEINFKTGFIQKMIHGGEKIIERLGIEIELMEKFIKKVAELEQKQLFLNRRT